MSWHNTLPASPRPFLPRLGQHPGLLAHAAMRRYTCLRSGRLHKAAFFARGALGVGAKALNVDANFIPSELLWHCCTERRDGTQRARMGAVEGQATDVIIARPRTSGKRWRCIGVLKYCDHLPPSSQQCPHHVRQVRRAGVDRQEEPARVALVLNPAERKSEGQEDSTRIQ